MNRVFYESVDEEVRDAICGHCGKKHVWYEKTCCVYKGKFICNMCFQMHYEYCDRCHTLHQYSEMNQDIVCKTCRGK